MYLAPNSVSIVFFTLVFTLQEKYGTGKLNTFLSNHPISKLESGREQFGNT